MGDTSGLAASTFFGHYTIMIYEEIIKSLAYDIIKLMRSFRGCY